MVSQTSSLMSRRGEKDTTQDKSHIISLTWWERKNLLNREINKELNELFNHKVKHNIGVKKFQLTFLYTEILWNV